MKNIKDIVKELVNHPDFVHCEIYVKDDYVKEASEMLYEEGVFDTEEECIREGEKYFEENRDRLADDVANMLGQVYEWGSPFESLHNDLYKKYEI